MIFAVLNVGLPCFPSPIDGLISAMIVVSFVDCDCVKCLEISYFPTWQVQSENLF